MAHTLDLSSARLQAGAVRGGVMREALGKLDVSRIAAESGVIIVHVAALMLLLAPMAPPPAPVAEEVITPYVERIPVVPPPRPPETVPVRVVQPSQRVPTPIVQPSVEPPPIDVTEPTEMDLPPAVVVADATLPRTTVTQPLAGAHLEYEIAPPPGYPVDAARAGIEGTVILRVLVGVDGKPLEVAVERSSGHRGLDLAARRQVLSKWRFRAAMQDGQSVQAIGLVPVVFKLDQ